MNGPADRPRRLAILMFDDVEVLDFAGPFEVFSIASVRAGGNRLRVFTVAASDRLVRAIGELAVQPTHTLTTCPAPDILVVPGGDGSRREMDNAALVTWVKQVHRNAELVMSVCSGARILARAGLLDGLQVTTHHQVTAHLQELAPRARVDPTRRFIDTGRIITTGGITAGIDGSLHVVARLFGEEEAREVARYMEYDWRRPDKLQRVRGGRPRLIRRSSLAASPKRKTPGSHPRTGGRIVDPLRASPVTAARDA